MNDSARFLLAKTSVVAAGIAGALVLTGCSGGSSATVSGRLDDTRWIPSVHAVTVPATRSTPVYSQRCSFKSKVVTTGTGKFKKTSSKTYQDCKKVQTGYRTERYYKVLVPARSAMYCVELDNVNGHRTQDDQWYEVTWSTYSKWSEKDEGAKVRKMDYLRSLAYCHR